MVKESRYVVIIGGNKSAHWCNLRGERENSEESWQVQYLPIHYRFEQKQNTTTRFEFGDSQT